MLDDGERGEEQLRSKLNGLPRCGIRTARHSRPIDYHGRLTAAGDQQGNQEVIPATDAGLPAAVLGGLDRWSDSQRHDRMRSPRRHEGRNATRRGAEEGGGERRRSRGRGGGGKGDDAGAAGTGVAGRTRNRGTSDLYGYAPV